jgi:hypothetical protein
MEVLKISDFLNGKGFASYDLRDKVKELSNIGNKIINTAYTDYGGGFLIKF